MWIIEVIELKSFKNPIKLIDLLASPIHSKICIPRYASKYCLIFPSAFASDAAPAGWIAAPAVCTQDLALGRIKAFTNREHNLFCYNLAHRGGKKETFCLGDNG